MDVNPAKQAFQSDLFNSEIQALEALVNHLLPLVTCDECNEIVELLHRHLRAEGTAIDKPWLSHSAICFAFGDLIAEDRLEALISGAKDLAKHFFYGFLQHPCWENPYAQQIWYRTETP